jgi:hypothetical protein
MAQPVPARHRARHPGRTRAGIRNRPTGPRPDRPPTSDPLVVNHLLVWIGHAPTVPVPPGRSSPRWRWALPSAASHVLQAAGSHCRHVREISRWIGCQGTFSWPSSIGCPLTCPCIPGGEDSTKLRKDRDPLDRLRMVVPTARWRYGPGAAVLHRHVHLPRVAGAAREPDRPRVHHQRACCLVMLLSAD